MWEHRRGAPGLGIKCVAPVTKLWEERQVGHELAQHRQRMNFRQRLQTGRRHQRTSHPWPPGGHSLAALRLSSWNLVCLFQASQRTCREGTSLSGTDRKQSISSMSSFWLQRQLLCGQIFFFVRSLTTYCPCFKTLKKQKAKINFHRVQNGRLWLEPTSFPFQRWLVRRVMSYILGEAGLPHPHLLLPVTSPSSHPREVLMNMSCGQRLRPGAKSTLSSLRGLAEGPYLYLYLEVELLTWDRDLRWHFCQWRCRTLSFFIQLIVKNRFLPGVIKQCGQQPWPRTIRV